MRPFSGQLSSPPSCLKIRASGATSSSMIWAAEQPRQVQGSRRCWMRTNALGGVQDFREPPQAIEPHGRNWQAGQRVVTPYCFEPMGAFWRGHGKREACVELKEVREGFLRLFELQHMTTAEGIDGLKKIGRPLMDVEVYWLGTINRPPQEIARKVCDSLENGDCTSMEALKYFVRAFPDLAPSAPAVLAHRISPPVRGGGMHRPKERYDQSFAWHSSARRRAVLWHIRTRNRCTDCRRAGLWRVPQQERVTRHAVA